MPEKLVSLFDAFHRDVSAIGVLGEFRTESVWSSSQKFGEVPMDFRVCVTIDSRLNAMTELVTRARYKCKNVRGIVALNAYYQIIIQPMDT